MNIWYENYPEEIQNKIIWIIDCRAQDYKQFRENFIYLMNYARKESNQRIKGFCYYYLGEQSYIKSETNHSFTYVTKAIYYLKDDDMCELIAKAHNLMGVLHHVSNSYITAVEYYFKAIRVCQENSLVYIQAMIETNVASIYHKIKEYDLCIKNYKKSNEHFNQVKESKYYLLSVLTNLCGIGDSLLCQGKYEEAIACQQEIQDYIKRYPEEEYFDILVVILNAKIYATTNQKEDDRYTNEVIEKLKVSNCIMECIDDVFEYMEFLIENKQNTVFCKLIDVLEDKLSTNLSLKLKLRMLNMKMVYYDLLEDWESYIKVAKEYQIANKEYNNFLIHSNRDAINTRIDIELLQNRNLEMEREQESLELKSKIDALSGLPNRAYLDEYSKQQFEYAKKERLNFGVTMLDIDYFKQYNDEYGHPQGDECIRRVSQVLKSVFSKKLFCARYGGDEFVLISVGHNKAELEDTLRHIQSEINKQRIEHKGGQKEKIITVSQGAYIKKIHTEKLEDYLNYADKNLYKVKKRSRNYFIITP